MSEEATFTGRTCRRATPRQVRLAEAAARICITAGGLGTILAVVLILVFLIWVVAPLFGGADVGAAASLGPRALADSAPLAAGADELGLLGWTLGPRGDLVLFTIAGGERLAARSLFDPLLHPTAWSFAPGGTSVACGFQDGSVRVGRIGFVSRYLEGDAVPALLRAAAPGSMARTPRGVARVTPEGQVRAQEPAPFDWVLSGKAGASAVALLDSSITPSGNAYGILTAAGNLGIYVEHVTENWMTGEKTRDLQRIGLPYKVDPHRGKPDFLALSGVGRTLFLIWRDGRMVRFDARGGSGKARIAETTDLTPEAGVQVTRVCSLIGKTTLLVGDSSGRVRAWFPTKGPDAGTLDGTLMVPAHTLSGPAEPVTCIAAAPRSRVCAIGYAGGEVRIYHVTSAKLLARMRAGPAGEPVEALGIAPKEDLLLAFTGRGGRSWPLDLGYPEASFGALFDKVWYEGYAKPAYVWQSSAGTDDFEEKLGLMPLIFGTLKATLYAMLLAIPIALFAALFTSEFLHPRARAPIKSAVEMMAGLPSVVLGFLAALVIAPFVQGVLASVLAGFILLPIVLLLGARLWQLLPGPVALRLSGLPRFAAIAVALPLAVRGAVALGAPLERAWFGGDLRKWLDAPDLLRNGAALSAGLRDPFGGWCVLLLPATGFVVALTMIRWGRPWLRRISKGLSTRACAWADLAWFGAGVLGTFGLAWAGAAIFSAVGFDPRGGVIGGYAQRNALIVGFVMGFAIVPIIYTLAEDALSSVPTPLREASLGAGASRWQTAVRVILPTAMSGIFGALMVGLGRAVGETMIVLMAAGNTPIMDWNLFNGFRTLSANIAVELPEAVRGSTHYRTLFLAALVLFAMTFVINTIAELVRRRVRRRFGEL